LDRRAWLLDRRAAVEAVFDAEAPTYDEHPYPAAMQPRFIERLVATCPPDGVVLDAPCGTGQYFPVVAAAGRRVVGIDQSVGMLEQAQAKGIAVALHHLGLQELRFEAEFDAVMTIDAMENVFPEDWPLVLANLHRAVRSGGHLYLTVEEVAETVVDGAFAALVARGLPVVRGEVIEGGAAPYHYYPGRDRVMRWLEAEGLAVVEQDTEAHEGWGYWHLLLRSRADAQAEGASRQPTSR
jgi:ubiquinone/menaquinone biosynthesis C-methylase UbiE